MSNRNEFVQKRQETKIFQFSILHHLVSIETGFGMFVRNIILISNVRNVKEKMKNASLCRFYFTTEYDSEHWQHRAQTESTFPFLYIIIFQRWESFEPLSSTLGGDRHMRLRTFLYKIQHQKTFILNFF